MRTEEEVRKQKNEYGKAYYHANKDRLRLQ